MWFAAILALLIVGCGAGGMAYLRLAMPPWIYPRPLRILLMLGPLLASSLVFVLLAVICGLAQSDGNASSVAPVIAMAKGFPLYPDPANGVLSQWLDGPFAALIMWPATFCTHATSVILVAGAVLLMVWLLPTICLLFVAIREHGYTEDLTESFVLQFAVLSFVTLGLLLLNQTPTMLQLSSITVEAPATALLACAVVPLLGARRVLWLNIAISATSMALAFWTKIGVWPAMLGVPIYLLVADGRRAAAIYVAALAAIGAVITSVILTLFGRANLWFYVATLPHCLPWQNTSLNSWQRLFVGMQSLLRSTIWPIVILTMVILIGLCPVAEEPQQPAFRLMRWFRVRLWLQHNGWVLLLISPRCCCPAKV